MNKPKDMTGQRFGRLTVTEIAGRDKGGRATWICVCDCGNTVIVEGYSLRSRHTTSCGCTRRDTMRNTGRENANKKHIARHGMTRSRLYNIWQKMKSRCYNAHASNFNYYGGRGITVCDEWLHSFEAFRDWALANGYRDDLTIDREDNDGPYCPENCRWATMKQQSNNRHSNRGLTYNGKTQTARQWADELGVPYEILRSRISQGWSIERALTTTTRR